MGTHVVTAISSLTDDWMHLELREIGYFFFGWWRYDLVRNGVVSLLVSLFQLFNLVLY